jgi:hypothetical protein
MSLLSQKTHAFSGYKSQRRDRTQVGEGKKTQRTRKKEGGELKKREGKKEY